MTTNIRIGNFNLENLFTRYTLLDTEKGSRGKKPIDPQKFVKEGGTILMLKRQLDKLSPVSGNQRSATAKVISANAPDILFVQEVENIFAMRLFNTYFLKNHFAHAMLVDGNDQRDIDVGVYSRYPITHVRSYADDLDGKDKIFSRDCLEVGFDIKGKLLTAFVNHFKSKIGGGEAQRQRQAARVAKIVAQTKTAFVIAGDLNMSPDEVEMKPLLKLPVENVVARLPQDEQWTHAYKRGKGPRKAEFNQFDYLLVSKDIAGSATPIIERRGLSQDITNFTAPRFPMVKGDGTEASDHCAVFFDLKL